MVFLQHSMTKQSNVLNWMMGRKHGLPEAQICSYQGVHHLLYEQPLVQHCHWKEHPTKTTKENC